MRIFSNWKKSSHGFCLISLLNLYACGFTTITPSTHSCVERRQQNQATDAAIRNHITLEQMIEKLTKDSCVSPENGK